VSTRTPGVPGACGAPGDERLRRRAEDDQAAGARQEAAHRILGVDAALDRPAGARDVGLREGELLAGGDADHLLDQVEPGDRLGDRVLDLEPRVHLEEVEALVLADDELDRSRRLVVHRLGERHRLLAHRLARSSSRNGLGASSTTFWWRRWIEHSRSHR
jgi:hypothetical protein